MNADLIFAVVTAAALVPTVHSDLWLRSRATGSHSMGQYELAQVVQPLGNVAFVLPVLAAGFGIAHFTGRPQGAATFGEMAISVTAAGAGSVALKELVGRQRPSEQPTDIDVIRPFSGGDSFPSGHTAVAFALAESVNLTTRSRWAPWITYPTATLVGWSRVHDDVHWASDVVAGAALGVWTAHKTHVLFFSGAPRPSHLDVGFFLPSGEPGLLLTAR